MENNPKNIADVLIIGGGAAGFFAAANLASLSHDLRIVILEQGREVLQKVRVSGGGRCNVTHACWDPSDLVKYYPRGSKEMLGPFHKFACGDTVAWFEDRGVPLKIEEDGRMFPVTDDSSTIIDCLLREVRKGKVSVVTSAKVNKIENHAAGYEVVSSKGVYAARFLLVASGSSPFIWGLLSGMGYEVVAPVPSLFTFNIKDKSLNEMMGLSVHDAEVVLPSHQMKTRGPILITHWGLSGPAVLRMSAIAARILHALDYRFDVQIAWVPDFQRAQLDEFKKEKGSASVGGQSPVQLPSRLWKYLVQRSGIQPDKRWADLSKEETAQLFQVITSDLRTVQGKSTFKEEFVTAGGVDLKQIKFSCFESKLHDGLYFAGEVLDIDAVTGGFNFQAAWTGAYLAAKDIAEKIKTIQ